MNRKTVFSSESDRAFKKQNHDACYVSLQMASQVHDVFSDDEDMFDAANMVTLNGQRVVLTQKHTKVGNPYLLVEKKAGARVYRSCWFPEDWQKLRQMMHVVSLRTSQVSLEEPVRYNKFLTIGSTPTEEATWRALQVAIKTDGKPTYSIHFNRNEWLHLCELDEYITTLLAPKKKQGLKRKRSEDECIQYPVMSRPSLPYYRYVGTITLCRLIDSCYIKDIVLNTVSACLLDGC